MRDAIVAAMYQNIFNKHCDRVKMANIAQVVNVLQAVILTDGEKLVKTPTYHVFDLFKEHQGAEQVYAHLEEEKIERDLPMLTYSASMKGDQLICTIANCSLTEEAEVSFDVAGRKTKTAAAEILTGEVHAHNDFDNPETVVIRECPVSIAEGRATIQLPPCSVVRVIL
jgi:alpha-N-arabinofuranosidase